MSTGAQYLHHCCVTKSVEQLQDMETATGCKNCIFVPITNCCVTLLPKNKSIIALKTKFVELGQATVEARTRRTKCGAVRAVSAIRQRRHEKVHTVFASFVKTSCFPNRKIAPSFYNRAPLLEHPRDKPARFTTHRTKTTCPTITHHTQIPKIAEITKQICKSQKLDITSMTEIELGSGLSYCTRCDNLGSLDRSGTGKI